MTYAHIYTVQPKWFFSAPEPSNDNRRWDQDTLRRLWLSGQMTTSRYCAILHAEGWWYDE